MQRRADARVRHGTRYDRHADLGIEHIAGHYLSRRFPPHSHDTYLVGLTIGGCEVLIQDGRQYVSRPGNIRLINPGIIHGGGCGEGAEWRYEALYVPVPLMREASATIGCTFAKPRLGPPVLDDPALAAELRMVFETLRHDVDTLNREEVLATFLVALVSRTLDRNASDEREEARAITIARGHLEAHVQATVRLDALAQLAGLSKFHLLRLFKLQTGLTPWQYQTQLRIERAKRLLAAGRAPSEVAIDCGFTDQSHLTRHFGRTVGVAPAAFAAGVRRA